jgi:hypothetical protein
MDTAELFKSKEFWIAVTAGLLPMLGALIGVWLANRSSLKLIRTQLQHDAIERARERQMTMKREVYLPAAVSISKLQSLLMQITNLSISDDVLSRDAIEHVAEIGKIHIVGSDTTVKTLVALMDEFGTAFRDLFPRRSQLAKLEQAISQLDEDKRTNEGEFKDWHPLLQERAKQLVALLKASVSASQKVAEKMPPAIFAIREEMELPLDRDVYLMFVNEALRKNIGAFEEMISAVEQQMIEDRPHPPAIIVASPHVG